MDYINEYISKNPTMHLEHSETKLKELLEVIPPKIYKSILDVGCGAGAITIALKSILNPDRMVGLDVSGVMLAKARQLDKNETVEWVQKSIYEISNDIFFDLVICADVVEHIEDDSRLIKHLATIGRNIVIRIPLEDSTFNRLLMSLKIYDPFKDTELRYGHIHHYNESQLEKLFKEAGLIIKMSIYKAMPKRSKMFWEVLRILCFPISLLSISAMVRFIGGFKIYLLEACAE